MGKLSVLPQQLSTLACEIIKHHDVIKSSLESVFEHACQIGSLLLEAKASVPHGEWSQWVETNCPFGIRQAQKYMRLFENRQAIEAEGISPEDRSLDSLVARLANPVIVTREDPVAEKLVSVNITRVECDEDRVIYPAPVREADCDGSIEVARPYKRPAMGDRIARDAIKVLKTISKHDENREIAFEIVLDWLLENDPDLLIRFEADRDRDMDA